jgi:hypothetical protein
MSGWDVVLGSGLGFAGTVLGGYVSTLTARRDKERESLNAAYAGWIKQATEACRLAERANVSGTPQSASLAEDALDALVPFVIEMTVWGASEEIGNAVQELGLVIRKVRIREEDVGAMRPQMERVTRLIAKETRRKRKFFASF